MADGDKLHNKSRESYILLSVNHTRFLTTKLVFDRLTYGGEIRRSRLLFQKVVFPALTTQRPITGLVFFPFQFCNAILKTLPSSSSLCYKIEGCVLSSIFPFLSDRIEYDKPVQACPATNCNYFVTVLLLWSSFSFLPDCKPSTAHSL